MPAAAHIEAGYRLVPLPEAETPAPLRICLVMHTEAAGGTPSFVLLRDLPDASVYLGCIADAGLGIQEWVEVWVQNVDRFADSFPAIRESTNNLTLDHRWSHRAQTMRDLDPRSFITTGWETAHPRPIFFDPQQNGCVHPIDRPGGQAWELCQDDALLASKGLPAYRTSLCRYLHLPQTADSSIIAATVEAPQNEGTRRLDEAFPGHIPLNAGGGLMMVRRFTPIGFEEWADLLSGKPWTGIEHGRDSILPGDLYKTLQEPGRIRYGAGHLFVGNQGLAGRVAETFHLKLHLLASIFRLVRSYVQAHQLPLLNITPSSFRISLAETDAELPFLWSFKTVLAIPGDAIALAVETTDTRYFIPGRSGDSSIFRPPVLGQPIEGSGSIRIRKVAPGQGAQTVLEGTLGTSEPIGSTRNDLLWLRLPLPTGRVNLYAQVDVSAGAAPGEVRFRTLPQQLSDDAAAALRQAEGVVFSSVPFQTVPLLSSPCDLYALAVLALRTLLVDNEMSLPVALDEVLSLARHTIDPEDASGTLGERVRSIAQSDPRISAALGPHRLVEEKLEPANMIFPADLWWDTIGLMIRLFPGFGPDSFCQNFGDAPPLALENVFNEPLAALENLMVRSRSLVVIDWNYNREVNSVLRELMARGG